MAHHWEMPPPIPDHGDINADIVYTAVGKSLTAWETIEFELSRLYSVFAGDPDGLAMREYGKPTIARLRLDGLSEAAGKFFVGRPSQQREGELHSLLARFRHFASRRNEIAHGIVFDIHTLSAFSEHFTPEARRTPQYALIAPYYQIKQHDPDGLPAYAYTSWLLAEIIPAMAAPFERLVRFRNDLLGRVRGRSVPSRPSAEKPKKKRQNALQRSARRKQRRPR